MEVRRPLLLISVNQIYFSVQFLIPITKFLFFALLIDSKYRKYKILYNKIHLLYKACLLTYEKYTLILYVRSVYANHIKIVKKACFNSVIFKYSNCNKEINGNISLKKEPQIELFLYKNKSFTFGKYLINLWKSMCFHGFWKKLSYFLSCLSRCGGCLRYNTDSKKQKA